MWKYEFASFVMLDELLDMKPVHTLKLELADMDSRSAIKFQSALL